ncbi:condensin complex subunit 2 [Condylostylus longicornis]|uniref:condensin complex subunit 2 n=1 Tax=Condylostylus longicornis TaxID=2530218 RepID=UPI00244E1BEE|nr:condensin complex subunit 2 [Condylostylus longicornis]
MTPTHTDTPLRRSNMSVFKTPAQTPINDDEEERRQARRRTILDDSASTASSTIENNQTLKDCLKIFTDNKLSKENAWSVSLIDTLSNLLDKHHKSLNNFKVAGSSLEASSKVYGLRVDSVHTDVVRMSAGLYKDKQKESANEAVDDENNDKGDQNGPIPENGENAPGEGEEISQPKRKKRKRKQVSTVTRNEDTINGHLDTHPCTDPIFAKLNSIIGSINSSNRLLQNILPTVNSELKLKMSYLFWDPSESKNLKYEENFNYEEEKMAEFKPLEDIKLANCFLRPDQSGYVITDTPADPDDDDPPLRYDSSDSEKEMNSNSMALAFDINADVEPEPLDTHTFVDIDIDQFNELTQEEQIAINKCKGLRRVPVVIEDMRPVDSTSNLEYSYRPLDKISQFWAGPSHWKFKKSRKTSFSMVQRLTQSTEVGSKQKQRPRRVNRLQPKQVQFGETHDDLFQKLDSKKSKLKKANVQKKWDAKKLKLPTDLQIDEECFDVYEYGPAIQVSEIDNAISPDLPLESYDYNNATDQQYCSNIQNDDDFVDDRNDDNLHNNSNHDLPEQANASNTTVMEISTDYEGAPDKVIRVVVPFAKRAKVIDMKQLKYCCMSLIKKDFGDTEKENLPNPPSYPNEKYNPGVSTFKNLYTKLPKILTPNMADALSTTVAFYSILHLANDNNLRLVQQNDLNDFQIRQLNV